MRIKNYLLALSGGSDSLALMHLLLEAKVPFSAAHVDHGWRESSHEEARSLQAYCLSLGVPFYLHTSSEKSGSEEAARKERLQFFEKLVQEKGFKAVFLAHHAGDVAETTLKRVLEGSALSKLEGLQSLNQVGSLTLVRPLLSFTKVQLRSYLSRFKLPQIFPIEDVTNLDSRYLRGKMRSQIVPDLERSFGKNVVSNLVLLSKRASRLSSYLDTFSWPKKQVGVWGCWYDVKELHAFLLESLLKKIIQEENILLSYQTIEKMLQMRSKVAKWHHRLILDRDRLFVLKEVMPEGRWIALPFNEKEIDGSFEKRGWEHAFQGEVRISVKNPHFEFVLPTPSIKKKYLNDKVPSFLWETVPCLLVDGELKELLTSSKERKVDSSFNFKIIWENATLTQYN